jgi:hypothetical protein
MLEDRGGAAYGLEDGSGLHLYGMVNATTINERHFAFLNWQWSAFAVEVGDDSLAELVNRLSVRLDFKVDGEASCPTRRGISTRPADKLPCGGSSGTRFHFHRAGTKVSERKSGSPDYRQSPSALISFDIVRNVGPSTACRQIEPKRALNLLNIAHQVFAV